jgi:hypothetical protein
MSEPVFEAPEFDRVANYPDECRARFLALCGQRLTASPGRLQHFIMPDIDATLDDFLCWYSVYGDGQPL